MSDLNNGMLAHIHSSEDFSEIIKSQIFKDITDLWYRDIKRIVFDTYTRESRSGLSNADFIYIYGEYAYMNGFSEFPDDLSIDVSECLKNLFGICKFTDRAIEYFVPSNSDRDIERKITYRVITSLDTQTRKLVFKNPDQATMDRYYGTHRYAPGYEKIVEHNLKVINIINNDPNFITLVDRFLKMRELLKLEIITHCDE